MVDRVDTDELKRLGAARKRADERARELAEQLRPAAIEALRAGVRPGEVAEITGWSPAQLRVIARIAGVEPAKRGKDAARD